MATVAFLALLYYGIFFTKGNADLAPSGLMDDYDKSKVKEQNDDRRDLLTPEAEDYNHDAYYYDSDEGENDMLRNKRNLSASSNDAPNSDLKTSDTATSTTLLKIASQEVTMSSVTSSTSRPTSAPTTNTTTGRLKNAGHQTTVAPDDSDPDFHLGKVVMDSVFNHAEHSDMKQALGLCRKNADIKVPQFKATLFPSEQAVDILNCINDLLKNQTRKQICLHLDAEMSAYLKWLVLTGESKERHKPVKIASKDDFLFPSSCVTERSEITPECLIEPIIQDSFEER